MPIVAVSAINVMAASSTIANGATLLLSADVQPVNATNKIIIWSVKNGTGSATIAENGMLSATGAGTVTVTATSLYSGTIGTKEITIVIVNKTIMAGIITTEVGANHKTPVYVLTSTDYTAASWTTYTNAVAEAILVEANANADQTTVDSATTAIEAAKTALVFANKAVMDAAIIAANAKVKENYSAASWTQFASARAAALAMPVTTYAEMAAKITALNHAIALLKADKTTLTAAITAEVGANHGTLVYALTAGNYTAASWTVYTNAVAAAILVEADVNAVQIAIDSATAAIETAKTALVFINKTTLTAVITAEVGASHGTPAYVLTAGNYTTVSWTAYADAVAAAILVEADANADQTTVDSATTAIKAAKTALVFANKAAMDAAVKAANAKVQVNYTAASWTQFASARATALAMPVTTYVEIGARIKALNDAIALLKTDKTALTAAITAEIGANHGTLVYALTAGNYTATSWTAYTNAVTAAILVEADVNAVQIAIDSATAALGTAKTALVFVNKTVLTAAITAEVGANHGTPAYVLTSTDYTTASWTAYADAVAAAILVEVNANEIQATVDSATTAIETAKTALVYANKAAMDAVVIAANAKVQENYSAASWTQFASARAAALAMPVTTNAEMGARTTALNDAIALLQTDKVALTAAITAEVGANHGTLVYTLTAGNYTATSWTAYANAVAAAILVEADANAVQIAIDSATAAIGTAKTALVFVNKTALTAAITAEVGVNHGTPAYVLTSTDYTTASWTAYADAVAAAILVEANSNAIQATVDSATTAMETAKTALVFVNKAVMDAAVIAANAKVQVNYSAASWTQFASARAAALAMPVTTNAEMGARTTALNDAIALLKTDKSALTAAITAEVGANHETLVYTLTAGNYTATSWTTYTNAVAAAILVEADANAVQIAIDSATIEIGIAKAALVFVNKTALTAAITAEIGANHGTLVYALTAGNYTATSWTAYTNAVAAAILVEADVNAVQIAVDSATAAIGTAKTALVFVNKTALTAAITAEVGTNHGTLAYVLSSADYTAASWTAYADAVAAAILVEANANAVQATVDSATTAIETTKTALVFANKAAMDAVVIAANAKVQVNYSAASWTQFASARATALAMPVTTNAEMGARTTALNDAIALLKTDKAALTAAITAEVGANHGTLVYTLTAGNYTATSWTAYTNAVAAAILVEADANAVQIAIDNATAAIGTAKTALVIVNKTALTAAITAEIGANHGTPAYVLSSTDYTTASWTAYVNAVAAAILVEANANSVQATVDSATTAIGTTKSALVFANKAAMDAAVIAVNNKQEIDYTIASWTQFTSARTAALALPTITNADMGTRAIALNNAILLLVEKLPETLSSIAITNLNYETLFATQASIQSKVIQDANFDEYAGKNKSFYVSDSSGNTIFIDLRYNIPVLVNDLPSTPAVVVGSAVESYIQQYFVDKGGSAGLDSRTLWANGYGDRFSIGAFGVGPTGKITITGIDAAFFFDTFEATGTNEDHSKNRTFTINDGTNTTTITLDNSYVGMAQMVSDMNSMLTSSQASAVMIDETHFKLVTKTKGIHLIIDGVNKADFFSSFESN